MKLLDLPRGYQTQISDDDWALVEPLTLYRGTNGYVYYSTWEDGRSVPRLLHRLLTDAPTGTHVDHINGDPLDNRRENLRVTTPQLNQANRKRLNRNNTSGIRGVQRLGKRWRAQIGVGGTSLHLGLFSDLDAAIHARRQAELEFYGEACP